MSEGEKKKPSWLTRNIRSEIEENAASRDQFEVNAPRAKQDGAYYSESLWHRAVTGFVSKHAIRYRTFE